MQEASVCICRIHLQYIQGFTTEHFCVVYLETLSLLHFSSLQERERKTETRRERETETETDRQTDIQTKRLRQTDRDTKRNILCSQTDLEGTKHPLTFTTADSCLQHLALQFEQGRQSGRKQLVATRRVNPYVWHLESRRSGVRFPLAPRFFQVESHQ